MFSKVAVLFALVAVALAGHEAPPAKAVTYHVPNVAKVTYPGPTVTRNVETYSAPSIEKTVLITRTITAPLNAPAVKTVQYSAPAVPVAAPVAAYGVAAPAYGVPSYAAPAHFAYHPQVAYAGVPAYAGYAAHGHGINGQTVYSAPALGISLGEAAYASPAVAVSSYAAPVSSYGVPAAAAVPAAEYGSPAY